MFDRRALIGAIILGVIIVASPAYTQEKSIVVASTTSGMKRKYHILDRELCRSLHLSRQPSCPLWVKKQTSRHLQRMSALPPKADID